ncbi:hypothetical protein CYMTET_47165 [Cymbomonas tetramitiformis]|uniref:HNH nuclease domain-containing protein n=1 Tax=Cymbomonas tetramitiformis TaxID=36881 RepID=A0AAE0BUQ9_9CHLO|nr:hypothetical protein CYMTET_47165 [Cymbomonas tetramitiformis]
MKGRVAAQSTALLPPPRLRGLPSRSREQVNLGRTPLLRLSQSVVKSVRVRAPVRTPLVCQGSNKHTVPAKKPRQSTINNVRDLYSDLEVAGRPLLNEDGSEDLLLPSGESLSMFKLNSFKSLVLDVSFTPVDVVSWQRGIILDILGKADVVEYYDQCVRGATTEFQLPAVLKVNFYVAKRRATTKSSHVNRRSILLRDNYKCQYCGCGENLTIDHVKPVSKGGPWSWDNLVTACSRCNTKKGSKTPEAVGLRLARQPKEPLQTNQHIRRYAQCALNPPDIWKPYLPAGQEVPYLKLP